MSAPLSPLDPIPLDIASETLIGLPAAARLLPPYRDNKPVNPSTIWRWVRRGITLPDGRRIRLQAIRLGNRWLTSKEALSRFALAQTPSLTFTVPEHRTPAQRLKASGRAGRALDRLSV